MVQPIGRQQRVVLGAEEQCVGQEGLEVAGSQGVRRALELDQGKLAQVRHQPRQDSPDGGWQFALLPAFSLGASGVANFPGAFLTICSL